MKNFLLSFFFAFCIFNTLNAQTQKGSKMIGGSGNIRFDETFSASLNPSGGYFILDNFTIGSGVPLNYIYYKPIKTTVFTGGLEPFIRYYIGQTPVRVFGQVNGMANFIKVKNSGEVEGRTGYIKNSYGGGIGLAYFLTQQVGLEAKLNYTKYQPEFSDKHLDLPRESIVSIDFGIQVYLPSSKD